MLRAGQWAGRLRSSLSRHLGHHHRSQHSAATIRSNFLEFFRAKDHTVVGSVSVLPHHDPSLAFVNAGMVPWKGVFQGKRAAPAPRLANSQRCVRVGGKHNDLDVVGELVSVKKKSSLFQWNVLLLTYCLLSVFLSLLRCRHGRESPDNVRDAGFLVIR